MTYRRRILLVNPNTNRSVTSWLAAEARRSAGPEVKIEAVNAASGLAAIETPADVALATQAVLDAIGCRAGIDGAVIAAFGDPGLDEARISCNVPVSGLGEAGLRAAAQGGRRFGVVTLGAAMEAPIRARLLALELAPQCTGVTILPCSIGAMVADRHRYRAAILTAARASFDQNDAEAVLLGGAPFAGLARTLSDATGRTVLDGVTASVLAVSGWPGDHSKGRLERQPLPLKPCVPTKP